MVAILWGYLRRRVGNAEQRLESCLVDTMFPLNTVKHVLEAVRAQHTIPLKVLRRLGEQIKISAVQKLAFKPGNCKTKKYNALDMSVCVQ